MDLSAIVTLLLPVVQTVITDFISTARVTSPLLNPGAPLAVIEAHPYPTIKLLQHAYNTFSRPAVLLDEDGVWGPKTDAAIAALLASYGLG